MSLLFYSRTSSFTLLSPHPSLYVAVISRYHVSCYIIFPLYDVFVSIFSLFLSPRSNLRGWCMSRNHNSQISPIPFLSNLHQSPWFNIVWTTKTPLIHTHHMCLPIISFPLIVDNYVFFNRSFITLPYPESILRM